MTLRPSLESKYSDNVTAEGLSVYKAAKQINVKMPGLKKTATASTDDSPLRQEVIVEEEIQHLDEQDMVGTSFDMLLDQSKQRDTIGKSILFKTQKSNYVEEGPCLSSNPVSIIITNIPSFKGGRANPWMESEQETMGIKDANRFDDTLAAPSGHVEQLGTSFCYARLVCGARGCCFGPCQADSSLRRS